MPRAAARPAARRPVWAEHRQEPARQEPGQPIGQEGEDGGDHRQGEETWVGGSDAAKAHTQADGREHHCERDGDCRCGSDRQEAPPADPGHAGDRRHRLLQSGHEAAEEDAEDAVAMEERLRPPDRRRIAREGPDGADPAREAAAEGEGRDGACEAAGGGGEKHLVKRQAAGPDEGPGCGDDDHAGNEQAEQKEGLEGRRDEDEDEGDGRVRTHHRGNVFREGLEHPSAPGHAATPTGDQGVSWASRRI